MAKIKVLFQHLPRETEENHKTPQHDRLFSGRDLNHGTPAYKAGC